MDSSEKHQWKTNRLSHWLTSAWEKGFREVISDLDFSEASAHLQIKSRDPNPDSWQHWQEPAWYKLPTGIGEGSAISVGCSKDSARRIAALIVGDTDAKDNDVKEAYADLLHRIAGSLSAIAEEKVGRPIEFSPPTPASEPEQGDLGVEYSFQLNDTEHLLAVVPNESFIEAIESTQPPEDESSTRAVSPAEEESNRAPANPSAVPSGKEKLSSTSEGDKPSAASQLNLATLLEVDLDLSVSFGKTELPLEEVLKLTSGAIVELNRAVSDPVDVLVNNYVIARGEVVVVDGNYGIRITEILSQKERIQSIF